MIHWSVTCVRHSCWVQESTGNVRPKQVNPAIHHWRVPELELSVLTPPAASALSFPTPLTPNSSTVYIIRQHSNAETHQQLVEENVYIYCWLQREAPNGGRQTAGNNHACKQTKNHI